MTHRHCFVKCTILQLDRVGCFECILGKWGWGKTSIQENFYDFFCDNQWSVLYNLWSRGWSCLMLFLNIEVHVWTVAQVRKQKDFLIILDLVNLIRWWSLQAHGRTSLKYLNSTQSQPSVYFNNSQDYSKHHLLKIIWLCFYSKILS